MKVRTMMKGSDKKQFMNLLRILFSKGVLNLYETKILPLDCITKQGKSYFKQTSNEDIFFLRKE